MGIKSLEVFGLGIPFVEAFAHSTKERRVSDAIVVKVTTDDGIEGFGEGLPRTYVTGEDRAFVFHAIAHHYWPRIKGQTLPSLSSAEQLAELDGMLGAPELPSGVKVSNAGRCAVELALVDAALKRQERSLADLLGQARPTCTYHGVVTASSPENAAKLAKKMKLIGLSHLKIKIGLGEDYERVKAVSDIMQGAPIRLDANANQPLDEALATIDELREFNIESIEAPIVPGDLDALKRYKDACPWGVVVDENLLTVEDANQLVDRQACSIFNVRLSKCGGLYPSFKMIQIAKEHGIELQIGAQVGETAILSAAARHLNLSQPEVRFSEGSFGPLLLTEDISKERISFGFQGEAKSIAGPGFGILVDQERLTKYAVQHERYDA